jgi:hypothetical protein
MLLEMLRQDEENIALAGPQAIRKALQAGVPVYYLDSSLGKGIVKEMPDGTRHLIEIDEGAEIILQTFAPR